jgi:internalin A
MENKQQDTREASNFANSVLQRGYTDGEKLAFYKEIADVNNISNIEKVKYLQLSGISQAVSPEFVASFSSLEYLHISYNSDRNIEVISNIDYCNKLKRVCIYTCWGIKDLSVLARCRNLTNIELNSVYEVDSIPNLNECEHLKNLTIYRCKQQDISFIRGCENLEKVLLQCNDITDISPLLGLKKIRELSLYGKRSF